MAATEKTLDRVRALLAKAEGTDNEHERDTFMAAAQSLMAKYGIEQAMLGAAERRNETPADRRIVVENPWADVKANLIYFVAEALGCKSIHLRGAGAPGTKVIRIFGFESDLERAELLYTSLLLQQASGAANLHIPPSESARAYRRSWLLGFNHEVVYRIKQAERTAAREHDQQRATSGTSTALVLADRKTAVEQAYTIAYPHTRRTSGLSSGGGGYGAGRAAGRAANLGGTSVGRGSRGAIGSR